MLSVIVLTKNSENTIADCIESLQGFGDEVIVVDSESTDRTIQIAERLGARIIKHAFQNFADQRNFAIKKSKGKWVLFIDSDEQATEEFKKEVAAILESHDVRSGVDGYFVKRKTFYYGKDWGMVDRVQRFFYKKNFIEWYGVLHETPKIKGEFGIIESPILHYTHNDISQMVEKTNEWSEYEAELRFNTNHPKMQTWRFFRVMISAFVKSYTLDKGYKNGTLGVIEAAYQAFSIFITYAKLWERQLSSQKP